MGVVPERGVNSGLCVPLLGLLFLVQDAPERVHPDQLLLWLHVSVAMRFSTVIRIYICTLFFWGGRGQEAGGHGHFV